MELLEAAKEGNLVSVRALLSDPSCDLLARDEEGNTALHIAASRGHHHVVLELASTYIASSDGVSPGINKEGKTAIHLACTNGSMKCVDLLACKFPTDLILKDSSGNTPLMAASVAEHNNIVLLLNNKYEANIGSEETMSPANNETREEKDEASPKTLNLPSSLLDAAKQGSLVLVKAILSDPSCDLLARDEEGNTALHIAASRGHHDVVLELASRYMTPPGEASAGVNNGGQTPLHLACSGGWIRCVDPLAIKFPNEVNISDSSGNTPIMAASLAGHETITSLLKERYKVDIESKGGKSPTHKQNKENVLKPKRVDLTVQTTHLLEAAKEGNLVLIRSLLSDPSCDLLARDEEGNTALHIAASRGHHDVVLELASRYMTPHAPSEASAGVNNEGETPLHLACSGGWIRCVDPLVIKFPNEINISDSSGNTPIVAASLAGHETITSLLKERYKVDIESKGGKSPTHKQNKENVLKPKRVDLTVQTTHLLEAAKEGNLVLVRSLLSDPSCDLLARDEEGNTALHIAASRGHHDVVLELASRYMTPHAPSEASAGVNNEGETPLHLACSGGWIRCVDPLAIKFPNEINISDSSGNTPIMAASLAGHETITSLLKESYKVDIESKGGKSLTHKELKPKIVDLTVQASCLLTAAKWGSAIIVRALLSDPSCDLLARDEEGNTALHFAASRGHHDVVLELASRYTSPSDEATAGVNTPLHLACCKGWVECVRTLATRFPGDLKVKNEYDNLPLHDAALFGHEDIVDCLCEEFGGDVDSLGHCSSTCLILACSGGHVELTQKLLTKYECQRDALDGVGGLASTNAAYYGHTQLLQMLIDEFNFSSTSLRLCDGQSLLHQACAGKHYETASILINKYNLDPVAKDVYGRTALHRVCSFFDDTLENVRNFHTPPDVVVTTFIDHLISLKCDPMDRNKEGGTALHYAALSGQTEVVVRLVMEYKCPVECRDNNERTPLYKAAVRGHAHVVQVLLSDLGADVEARNKQNDTALNIAAENGHSNVVTLLVDQFGCSPHTKGYNNRTPLHQACGGGHLELVEKLIDDYHCDPMARDDKGLTPLHIAALTGKEHVVRRLVSNYNCSVECRDNNEHTPLHKAAVRGHAHVVQVLLSDLGADVEARNKQNDTALNVAAGKGRSNVVTLLVDQFGCSPHTKGYNNRTPLHQACGGGHLELVEKLIDDYHCDPMARNDKGLTPLHIAALAGKEHVVRQLVSNYACPVECRDNDENTPLHKAAIRGHAHVVQVLLSDLGADAEARNKQNDTALNIAAENGRSNVVTLLVDQFGCSPHTKGYNNRTPLHQACDGGHLELVEKLIDDYHCDPMARDDEGLTPLHIAAWVGKKSTMTTLLLKYNCSPHVSDNDGDTLLHCSVRGGNREIVEILVDVIGTFSSIKNNHGETPIDWESTVLFRRPNIRSCVEFLSKHAVGEYRHAPPKLLVLDEGVTSALSKYSTYSLLSSPFAQSCGLCYVDSVGSDVWVCQVAPDTKHNPVLQSLVSGPMLMAVIAVSMNIPAGEAVSKVLSQVSLAKQLASQRVSKTVPLKILFTGTSTLNKQNLFNGICKDIVENQPDDFIHFFQHFFICEHDKYQEKMFPIVSKFINKSVSTIRNPDVPEITHGSIFLLKFLYRENRGKFYITFSELSKQLQNERIMTEDHPEEIHACLRQLDEKGYLIITGTSDDPQCIILNPLHMLQTMDEFSHNVSEPLAHVGLYSQKLLSSLCFECEFSFIESFLSKFNLSLLVREPLVNLVKKEHIDKHVGDHFFFIPQLATCHRQVKDWTCQPEKVFSCGLSVIAIGKESYFSSHFQTTILLEAMKFFSNSFVMEPYPPLDCRVWKGGIQWMVENIEVLLEVVSDGNRVVLMGRSDIRNQLRCMDMFVKVVDMVLDVKSMCCGGIVHKIEVMDPFALESRTIPSSNELLWCDASSVIRALRIGKKDVRSTCKTKEFSVEKLDWLQRFSLQDKVFPMDYKVISAFLEGVAEKWQEIARELGLSEQTRHSICEANRGNPELCCQQMVEECLIGVEMKLTWNSLTLALRKLDMDLLAENIYNDWGHHGRVQTMLRDDKSIFLDIDAAFQQQFAVVFELQWKHLAPYINPSAPPESRNTETVNDQIRRWRERVHPTFGDLAEILSRLYIQPPLPLSVVSTQHLRTPAPTRDPDESLPCHHSCPGSLSEMCSTSVHSEKVDITGKTIACQELGFSIVFPPGAVSVPVTISVCCSFKAEFSPPNGYHFVSPVYVLHIHPETQLLKKVTLSIQHWAKSDGSDLSFGFCSFQIKSHSYPFQVKDGGDFVSSGGYGKIDVNHFSGGAIMKAIVGTFSRMLSYFWGGEESFYRASLVWPVSTKKSGVDVWLYAISLSLDHNAVSKNILELMRGRYPDFEWDLEEKTRLEVEPETELFTVEPQAMEGVRCIRKTILKEKVDCMDRSDDIDIYPPRVYIEGISWKFTSCSVSIKNVKDCTFELSVPSGIHLATFAQSIPHKLLFERLYPVRARWYTIGICLYIPPGDLDAIATDHSKESERCLSVVLDKWTKIKCHATWEDVIGMLMSPAMKEVNLADKIKQEFKVETSLV